MSQREYLIDLLRHGEAAGGGRFRGGATDDPLTELGWQQMWQAVGEQAPWSGIISSPMQRCRDFAEALAIRHQLPVTIEPGLREMFFGAWEGWHAADIEREQPHALAAFWSNPADHAPPGAEPLSALRERVMAGLTRQLASYDGQHLLVIAHGGTLRMILCTLLDMPLAASVRLEMPHAAMSRVRLSRDADGNWRGSLVFHGGRP